MYLYLQLDFVDYFTQEYEWINMVGRHFSNFAGRPKIILCIYIYIDIFFIMKNISTIF